MNRPTAGQWYEWQGNRVYCVGQDSLGHTIVNYECGTINVLRGKLVDELQHLPDCTGWDWAPETFPQYWTKIDPTDTKIAFVRRIDRNTAVVVYPDGTDRGPDSWYQSDRTRLTEAEALALLDKPQPAEDPEEWVVQDRVPARVGVDEFRWSCWQGYHFHVVQDTNIASGMKHGQVHEGSTLSLRCRRKDLPAPKRTVTVPKWLVIDDQGLTFIIEQSEAPSGSSYIEVSKVGETTYEIE